MKYCIILGLAGLLAANAVNAQKTPSPKSKDDKLICHSDPVVGSLLQKRKVCMTAAQWRESSEGATDWMNKRTQELSHPGGG